MTYSIICGWCSDDDLTPYDMSGDQELSQGPPPRYLRDCLESTASLLFPRHLFVNVALTAPPVTFPHLPSRPVLVSSEDAVRVQLSLRVAEDLVRKNVFATREVRLHTGNARQALY